MRFTSFSLFFLTASFVGAKEDELQQGDQQQQPQQQKYHHNELSGVRSTAVRPAGRGKKNIRGRLLLVSGDESESNNTNNNHNYHYNDNVADKDAIVDVGILSLNSHQYHGSNDNHNLDRVLQESCNNCGTGKYVCLRASVDTIGACSCNGDSACVNSGYLGVVTIGENSCNGAYSCNNLATKNPSYSVVVGNGSCIGIVSCFYQGRYGKVEIGNGSCTSSYSCKVLYPEFPDDTIGKPIKIGNNACTCFECCRNIFPGSIIGDGQCNSLEDGCAGTLVNKPGLACSSPATNAARGLKKKVKKNTTRSSKKIDACSSKKNSAKSSKKNSAKSSKKNSAKSSKKNSAKSSKKNSAKSSKKKSSAADCKDFVCAFSSKLVEMCIVGTGESEASTQCISGKDVKNVFDANEHNKCGPCDDT